MLLIITWSSFQLESGVLKLVYIEVFLLQVLKGGHFLICSLFSKSWDKAGTQLYVHLGQ